MFFYFFPQNFNMLSKNMTALQNHDTFAIHEKEKTL